MSIVLANWAYDVSDYKGASRSVLHALGAFAYKVYDDGRIRMTRKQIARLLRMNEVHVSRLIKEMIDLNILTKDDEGLRFSDEAMDEARRYQIGTYQTGTPGTKVVPERYQIGAERYQIGTPPITPYNRHKDYKDSIPPIAPQGGRADGNTPRVSEKESLEDVLEATHRRWFAEHPAEAERANAPACHGNAPSLRPRGVGATTLPADPETPASVAPNAIPENLYEPDGGTDDPLLEADPIPTPAQEATAKPKPQHKYTERFEEWWKAYPPVRKTAKPQCFAKWKSILASGVTEEELFIGLARWINSRDWQKDDGQYVCNPQAWLNQERWGDTPIPAQTRVRELGGFQVPDALPQAKETSQAHAQNLAPTYTETEEAFLRIWCKRPADHGLFRQAFAETTAEITSDELNECATLFVKRHRAAEGDILKLRRPEAYLQDRLWTDDIEHVKLLAFTRLSAEEQERIIRENLKRGRKAI